MMPQPLPRTAQFTADATDELIKSREDTIRKWEIELQDIEALMAASDLMEDEMTAKTVAFEADQLRKKIRVQHFLLAKAQTRKQAMEDAANGKSP